MFGYKHKRIRISGLRAPYKPKPMPGGWSLLLEVPLERRNMIYQMVIEEGGPLQLSRNTYRRRLGANTAHVCVNKQIHDEVFDILFLCTNPIQTTVRNFNFGHIVTGHIVTFLNRLSEEELKKMVKEDADSMVPPRRYFKIGLFFSGPDAADEKLLQRWLNRMEHPTKKGTTVDCQYSPLGPKPWDPPAIPFGLRQAIRACLSWINEYCNVQTMGLRSAIHLETIKEIFEISFDY